MSYSRDGEERVYQYFNGRRILGFMPLLLSAINSQAITGKMEQSQLFQMTKSPCVLYQMRGNLFRKLLKEDLQFNQLMLQAVAANYMEVLNHFQHSQEDSAGIRFCRLLLEFCVVKDGVKVLPKTMTCLEISKYLGTHPVTVSRIVAQLKKNGCITKERGTITIQDEERLSQLIHNGAEIK